MMVAFVHAAQLLHGGDPESYGLTLLNQIATLGAAGVDIFFVLSGYLMFSIKTAYPQMHARTFIKRRFLRIAPLYYCLTLLFFGLLVIFAEKQKPTVDDLVCSLLFLPCLNAYRAYQPVLSVGWSLNYEMLFYLSFAATMLLRSSAKQLLVLIGMASLSLTIEQKAIVPMYFFEFLLGGGIHALRHQLLLPKEHEARFRIAFILGTTVIIWGYFTSVAYVAGGWLRFALWGLPSAFFVLTMMRYEPQFKSCSTAVGKCLRKIGDASYSLYLSHWIVGMITHKILSMVAFPSVIKIIFVYALMVLTGLLTYRWVELPLMRQFRASSNATARK